MIDLRQAKEWADWLSRTGWIVERVKLANGKQAFVYIRKIPVVGWSFLKLQRYSDGLRWSDLARLKRKYGVIMSALEPMDDEQVKEIVEHGYRLTKDAYLPTKTRIIDLTKGESSLLKDMSENFRRIINRGTPAEIVQISPDEFYEGWKKWSKTLVLSQFQFEKMIEAYGRRVEFWGERVDGEILSAIMLLFTPDSCFYYQTWTSAMGRGGSSHVILVWETIKRAKKAGVVFYNFEGIQDKRFPLKKWDGFSEFKRRFGGSELMYPGCFSKWL